MTPEQEKLDRQLWWTTVRPWLARIDNSWPNQHHEPPDQETST